MTKEVQCPAGDQGSTIGAGEAGQKQKRLQLLPMLSPGYVAIPARERHGKTPLRPMVNRE